MSNWYNMENLKNIRLIKRGWIEKLIYLYEDHTRAKLIYNDKSQKSKRGCLWQVDNEWERSLRNFFGGEKNSQYLVLNYSCVCEYNGQNTSN